MNRSALGFPSLWVFPRCYISPHPRPTLPISELDRWRRKVGVSTHVGSDAVLVREAEKLCHLTYIDEVIEIYLATHGFESIHVDSVTALD